MIKLLVLWLHLTVLMRFINICPQLTPPHLAHLIFNKLDRSRPARVLFSGFESINPIWILLGASWNFPYLLWFLNSCPHCEDTGWKQSPWRGVFQIRMSGGAWGGCPGSQKTVGVGSRCCIHILSFSWLKPLFCCGANGTSERFNHGFGNIITRQSISLSFGSTTVITDWRVIQGSRERQRKGAREGSSSRFISNHLQLSNCLGTFFF